MTRSRELTEKQIQLCRWVEAFWHEHSLAPTLQEIAEGLNMAGRSVAQQRVRLVARKGHLAYEPGLARSIRLTECWTAWKNSRLDRKTNPAVDRVFAAYPEKFAGWSEEEWRKLRSVRGMGGALTEEGVLTEVERINQNSQALRLFAELLEVAALREDLISWIDERAREVSPRNRKTVKRKAK